MKYIYLSGITALHLLFAITSATATTFIVSSQSEFDEAHHEAEVNDSIVWESGTYTDIYMNISKNSLYITSSVLGGTIFTGNFKVKITSDYITVSGFQFIGGDIGTSDVINTAGSYNHFDQLNIKDYTSYKYLVIRESCQYALVTHCNFENRLNLDDKNILSILVSEDQPGYHKIRYCSFKNFEGTGNDLGIEPIRIGLSTQADRNSRSVVEFCYFTQCNGDGEIISSKASQNIYRFNTFENNPKAELVLRHGSEAIVYGNFFLNGKGGVRVREGQQHYIYNNYFYELDDRAIYLQNDDSDPLNDINIAYNIIVDCSEIILGGDGSDKPTNVTLANNIFADPDDHLFEEATGTENWIGNMVHGTLGIVMPETGITVSDPLFEMNSEGYFGLAEGSPAIDAALPGYKLLPQFEGIESIDSEILYDIMGQERPQEIEDKDLACNEFPHNISIQPMATEENTGPDYNTNESSLTPDVVLKSENLISFFPNPSAEQIVINTEDASLDSLEILIVDLEGKVVNVIDARGRTSIKVDISQLSAGVYFLQAYYGEKQVQTEKFTKL